MLISTHGSCERGDLLRQPQHQGRTAISTHAPTGGATPVPRGTVRTILFLLAPPREGRRKPKQTVSGWGVFLLAPPREGRRLITLDQWQSCIISTRAPTGGATAGAQPGLAGGRVISTHAPTGGATSAVGSFRSMENISTHAPTGGATGAGIEPTAADNRFQLAPPREGATISPRAMPPSMRISTRAPTGGATERRTS